MNSRSNAKHSLAVLAVLVLGLGACSDEGDSGGGSVTCPSGTEGCACYGNQTCSESLVCTDGLCVEPACTTGDKGCECFGNGTCSDDLECVDGVCETPSCVKGTEGCPCYGNGTCLYDNLECVDDVCQVPSCDGQLNCACLPGNQCDEGLVCENDWCVQPAACPEGTEGCPCDTGDVCDEGLICDDGTCVEDTCVDGALDCPCITPGDICGDHLGVELECVDGKCAVASCPTGTEGCPCGSGGVCDYGLECTGDTESATCEQPGECPEGSQGCPCGAADACDEGLKCDAGTCVPQSCEIGDVGCLCAEDGSCSGSGTYCDADGWCQQADCPEGTEGCPCTSSGECGLNTRQEVMTCQSGLCTADSCTPGATGCACAWATTCDDADDECVDGFCMPDSCAPGQLNCSCSSGACVSDLVCREGVICVDGTGYLDGPCYEGGTCTEGMKCDNGTCQSCSLGSLGCACEEDGSCDTDLTCYQDLCVDPEVTELPPEEATCYTYCERDLVTGDGTFVVCPADGLMEGCYDGLECNNGSCTAPGESPPTCVHELDCAEWQTCIDGGCYSNCQTDGDCDGGEGCIRKVCRVLCEADTDSCPAGYSCVTDDGQVGACYALEEPTGTPQTQVHADFDVEDQGTELTNVKTSTKVRITNNSQSYEFFTVRKRSSRTYSAQGEATDYDDPADDDESCDPTLDCPLTWLGMGFADDTEAVQELDVGIEGDGGFAVVTIDNAGGLDVPRWEGRIEVIHPEFGTRTVQLNYNESPEGRWNGTVHYFATFSSTGLDAWRQDSASKEDDDTINEVSNALVRKWASFRLGDISWDNFKAVLQATRNESWRWSSVEADCPSTAVGGACYLYDINALGLVTYSSDTDSNPIPTGVVELPISMNLRVDDQLVGYFSGRIESEAAMQYPGNPAITLDFGSDPAACEKTDAAGNCKVFIESLDADIYLGGRYESTLDDANCAERSDGYYAQAQVPWLVPGFMRGTELDGTTGLRYRYECRDTYLPFNSGPGEELSDEQIVENDSLSLANPIPDGRTLRRTLTLVDGALINQSTLFVLFEEKYETFLPVEDDPATLEDEGSFSAYGYMLLKREATELDTSTDENADGIPDIYQGSVPVDDRPDPANDLLGVTCSEALLDELSAASDDIDGEITSPNAATAAQLLMTGKALEGACPPGEVCHEGFCAVQTCDSLECTYGGGSGDACTDPHIGPNSAEAVHYLCHDTGLIDGGAGAETAFYEPIPNDDLCGFTDEDSNPFYDNGTCEDGGPESDSSLCALGSDLADCGKRTAKDGDNRVACPAGSDVTFFTLDGDGWAAADIAALACQTNDPADCQDQLSEWKQDGTIWQLDPVWHCEDSSLAFCDSDRLDLRVGKQFFAWTETSAVMQSLHGKTELAFRYKTKFRNRDGETPGFAPQLCIAGSNQVPYCYDPPEIEAIRERIDCLLYLWRYHYDDVAGTYGDDGDDLGDELDDALCTTFAYAEACIPGMPAGGAHDGFERLHAELLVMMGDEAYTQAFASRFDLVGESPVSFEGELFEAGDINLSGAAGYEMHSLYLATQYYQEALDRFYSLSPIIWESLDEAAADTPTKTSFVTQETVTRYLERVIRASTQKSRAWSEIAKHYQDFNRPELAARVIERAFTATYVESVVIAQLLDRIYHVLSIADRDQVMVVLEDAQRRYRMATLDMRNVYAEIGDEVRYFGLPPDYIPFPTLNYNTDNAFEALLMRAKQKLDVARMREDQAIERSKAFDVDAEEFQSELVRLRNNYEAQLGDICGTFEAGGKIYPAIERYAELHEGLKNYGDPCGMAGNGSLWEAVGSMEIQRTDLARVRTSYDNVLSEVHIEKQRVEAQCDLTLEMADYRFEKAGKLNTMQNEISIMQGVISAADRTLGALSTHAQLAGCAPLVGDCPTKLASAATYTVLFAGVHAGAIATEATIYATQEDMADIERKTARWETQKQCDAALIDSNARTATLLLRLKEIELESLRSQHQVRLAQAEITEQYNRAKRIENELAESEQMSINIFAARADPNVRIYRDDAVVNAEIAFDDAIKEVYRTTRVFEYYSSQSYAEMEQLFLIRMVQYGDYNLQNYLTELENAFYMFEETYGLPDTRVTVVSLRDDILHIPFTADDGTAYSQTERIAMLREELADTSRLDSSGYLTIPFPTQLDKLSPLTRVHKVLFIESDIAGSSIGDSLARLYLRQRGTSVIHGLEDDKLFYRFPERVAVLNPTLNGTRVYDQEVYRNQHLRDRPLVNTAWDLVFNQRDEAVNQDIDVQSLTDIRLYIYYRDFTAL